MCSDNYDHTVPCCHNWWVFLLYRTWVYWLEDLISKLLPLASRLLFSSIYLYIFSDHAARSVVSAVWSKYPEHLQVYHPMQLSKHLSQVWLFLEEWRQKPPAISLLTSHSVEVGWLSNNQIEFSRSMERYLGITWHMSLHGFTTIITSSSPRDQLFRNHRPCPRRLNHRCISFEDRHLLRLGI